MVAVKVSRELMLGVTSADDRLTDQFELADECSCFTGEGKGHFADELNRKATLIGTILKRVPKGSTPLFA